MSKNDGIMLYEFEKEVWQDLFQKLKKITYTAIFIDASLFTNRFEVPKDYVGNLL